MLKTLFLMFDQSVFAFSDDINWYKTSRYVNVVPINWKRNVIRFKGLFSSIDQFTVGIKLNPTLKNPAADILGLFSGLSMSRVKTLS